MGCRGCDSIYAYFMMSILLDFTPQLDFAAGSYAMEEERTEQGWRHGGERMEQGWCVVEGRRAAARTTAVDVASPERSSLQR